ncbi:hypothetical protein [Methylobacter sp. BBA5.1]|uniref:hypothetical protein n=1 Tax=Methylobacter sp. BBA5.1 TaxID=1495064 RepID=UPI0005692128|nr:hypothetical protein [Methylobacter sp. BBA5.1]
MLRTEDFIPFAAPSTAAFGENSPKGRCMDAARCQRDRKSLLATLVESEERKEKAATGGLFFGYFLLAAQRQIRQERIWSALADPKGEAQGWASQRNSPSGAINPIK